MQELYPSNAVALKTVKEFIRSCLIYQMDRIKQAESLPLIYRTIKAAENSCVTGINHTKVSPRDKGNEIITVIVKFTGRTMLFLGPNPSVEHTPRCLHQYASIDCMIEQMKAYTLP